MPNKEVISVPKTEQPPLKNRGRSRFSIEGNLENNLEHKTPISKKNSDNVLNITHENSNKEIIPFTQEYIDNQWSHFLSEIKKKDRIVFNAVKIITLTKSKENENQIIINYRSNPSLTKFKENKPAFLKQFEQNNIELFFERQTYIPEKQENPLHEFSKLKKENQLFQELDDFFNLEVKII